MRAVSQGDVAGSPRRLWVTFDVPRPAVFGVTLTRGDHGDVMLYGCGVTGFDEEDCWRRIRAEVFVDNRMPPPRVVVLDIDVSTLDPVTVLPRIGNPAALGVWFPAWNVRPPA